MPVESFPARIYLTQKLKGDAILTQLIAGRVFDNLAPSGAKLPYIIVSFRNTDDSTTAGTGIRNLVQPAFLVKAVTQDGSAELAARIANRIDALICDGRGHVTHDGHGYFIGGALREGSIDYPESADGVRYNHLGGLYRLIMYEA